MTKESQPKKALATKSSTLSTKEPEVISNQEAAHKEHQHGIFSVMLMSLLFGFLGGFMATNLLVSDGLINSADSTKAISAEGSAVSKVAREVSPSVVSITVEKATLNPFFSREFVREGAGTGVILTEDGLILTNRHVVPRGITSVSVVLSDGTRYENVEVVDRDPFTDVAFIQIKNVSGLVPAKLGDSSQVRVGDKAIAIGNALGQYANTVTAGIISGLGRPVVTSDGATFDSLSNLLQTDASINPGNSGGPLVNIHGEVIGLNTAVAGGAQNIGFAIPINDIKSAISSVKKEGRIIRPYLGVRYISLTSDIAKALELSVVRGAYLFASSDEAVIPGSPADEAGLQEEDVIVKIEGQKIDERNTLATLLAQQNVGDEIVLEVLRANETINLTAILAEVPDGFPF